MLTAVVLLFLNMRRLHVVISWQYSVVCSYVCLHCLRLLQYLKLILKYIHLFNRLQCFCYQLQIFFLC